MDGKTLASASHAAFPLHNPSNNKQSDAHFHDKHFG
jgi:hypothetical protein